MQFFARAQKGKNDVPSTPSTRPCVVLLHDNWDDYGYHTIFHVFFFPQEGDMRRMGTVKILGVGHSTNLPGSFERLDDTYCSLGESTQWYADWIDLLGIEGTTELCRALRDVVLNPELGAARQDTEGFRSSLLRFSEAEKAYAEAGQYFGYSVPIDAERFAFTFTCSLAGFNEPHTIALNFTPTSGLPHRMITFVGKNGTGKSGVLAQLASALSGYRPSAGRFSPGRPRFSRTICASYTVFQPFEVPNLQTSSYRYCGLRDENDTIDFNALRARLHSAVQEIQRQKRTIRWAELVRLHDLLGPIDPDEFVGLDVSAFQNKLKQLSTGQWIVFSLFTDLVANVDQHALFLCDEPETYLHPTLLSTFLRLMHAVLDDFDAYSIIATHSPIVVQEVPSRYVRLFERQGTIPLQSELAIESFGENLTGLVDHVFRVNDDDKNYKTLMRALVKAHGIAGVEALFEGRLSVNARLLLHSLRGADEEA